MHTYRVTTTNKGKSVLTSTEEANLLKINFQECKCTSYDVVEVRFDSQSLLGSHSSRDFQTADITFQKAEGGEGSVNHRNLPKSYDQKHQAVILSFCHNVYNPLHRVY